MLTAVEILPLAPLLALLALTVLVLLLVAVRRHHGLTAGATAAGLAYCLALLPGTAELAPSAVTGLMVADPFGLFYLGLILAAALAASLMAYAYLAPVDGRREEFYVLLLAATLGAGALVMSRHFAAFFLGLELMSVSLFALVAYPVGQRRPLEAAVKYLVLAGLSSALLMFGLALIYYETGSLEFAQVGARATGELAGRSALLLAGHGLLLAGLGFKLSLAPFHFWAPDVYEGAPAPAVAFLATVSKGAVAALLLRYLWDTRLQDQPALTLMLEWLALLSIAAGNLLALFQAGLKRLLACSSIAHLGYLLVAVIAGGPFGAEAAAYYLMAYFVMTLGAFGVVAALAPAPWDGWRADDGDRLEAYRGLFWSRPWLAGSLAINLLSLAGIPLTVGFVAKFYLFAGSVGTDRWPLAAALVGGSVVGLFFYLRVVIALFDRAVTAPPGRPAGGPAWAGTLVLGVLALALVGLGIYPQPAMDLIRAARTPVSGDGLHRLRPAPPPPPPPAEESVSARAGGRPGPAFGPV